MSLYIEQREAVFTNGSPQSKAAPLLILLMQYKNKALRCTEVSNSKDLMTDSIFYGVYTLWRLK